MSNVGKIIAEELLREIDEIKDYVVVYAGRFQPFHIGHYKTYQHLVNKFGKANVYIGTSDKTDRLKSPFNFKEKKEIMSKMFDIPSNRIVQIKNPYAPTEILKKYDENTTAFITVVGEKDSNRLSGKYFTPYKGNLEAGYKDKGYVYISPSQPNAISGTDVRKWLGGGELEDRKKLFTKAYPKFNERIFNLIVKKLNTLKEGIFIPKEIIEDWVTTRLHDFLNEISISNSNMSGDVDDGPNFFFPNYDTFDVISKSRAEQIGYTVFRQIMSGELEDYYEHPIYPDGPVKAVTPFPAGVIGKTTATNQKDFGGEEAYSKWFNHVTRSMGLVGYQLVKDMEGIAKELAIDGADSLKPKEANSLSLDEDITIPVKIGDTILTGKFKNKKITVKDIGKNEKGEITVNSKPLLKYRLIDEVYNEVIDELKKDPQFEELLSEIPMDDLKQIDKFADKQLSPLDVVITDKHFMDRLVDPRNKKPISAAELIRFFKKLSRKKDEFVDFLKKYGEIVAKDNKTKINIPFMKKANKAIAKTIMRKDDFKTPSPELKFESSTLGLSGAKRYAKKHNLTYLTKKSGGRSPYIYFTKNDKEYGPFDTTILTAQYLDKKMNISENLDAKQFISEFKNLNEGMYDPKNIKAYYEALCKAEGIKPLPLKFTAVGMAGAATTYDTRTMKPLYISFDVNRLSDPEFAIIHELTHQIKLETEGDAYVGKRDQLTKFKKLENHLIDKYVYSKYSKLLYENKNKEEWAIFRLNSGKKWFATGYSTTTRRPDEYRADVKYSSPTVLKFTHDRAIRIIQTVIGIGEEYGIVNSKGIQKKFDWRVKYPKKYDDIALLINEDTVKYISKSLGVPRSKMPQIASKDVADFVKYIKDKGISVSPSLINVSKVGMTQKDINVDKVKGLLGADKSHLAKPVIISKDNYILDGHHRVAALYNVDNNFKLKTIKVDLGIKDLLKLAKEYPNTTFKSITEGSNIGTLGSGNNSTRWTPSGKKKELGVEQLSEYIQKDFPVADSVDISGEKDNWIGVGKTAKYNNKVRAKRDGSGNLVFENINPKQLGITDFKSLFKTMPSDLQKRIYNLKNFGQRLDKHPEGNVLKHTITVVNRSLKDNDIDIAIAAMLHDIGKDETAGIHPKKGHITHFGHENISASLVFKYTDWIKSISGNPANVLYIVKNHMRYKQLSDMRPRKQDKLKSFRAYDKLSKFSRHDRGGLSESKQLKLNIPPDIKKIHNEFKKNSKKLYVVGGAVRDAILGNSPKDFDLATDAKPDEVLQIAKDAGFSTTEVGKSFGVVVVNGHEIATFRKDLSKGRRPSSVDYTDIEGDVKRRDLTVNALFYDMDKQTIVDLVGGIADLKKKNIRTVGNAVERFDEDPLRKLRALRFQSRLGGKFDKELMDALQNDPSLNGVSAERIRDEFIKSIKTTKDARQYMDLSDKIGFTPLIFPNLKITKPYIKTNDYILFISALLRKNPTSVISKILSNLRYTNEEVNSIIFLISLQDFKPEDVFSYKKMQEKTSLSDNQILEFGKIIGKDFKKFINFKLSVGGKDVPSDIKGSQIGIWIKNKEMENFLKQ